VPGFKISSTTLLLPGWPVYNVLHDLILAFCRLVPLSLRDSLADYLHKRLHLFVLLWLAVSLMVGIQWAMSEYQRIQEEFDRSQAGAWRDCRKLDQNESVLAALDAMLMSRQKFDMPILKSFSHQLLSHYSQLYTVEFSRMSAGITGMHFWMRCNSASVKPFSSAILILPGGAAGCPHRCVSSIWW
jgi:hypothetical protein